MNDNIKNLIINNPKAKERINIKQIEHEIKGNYDPFCEHCEIKLVEKKHINL
ncbi:hypothetical protein M0R04_14395 [Candidatus Dojkabacteria bacterium]|jgi:hypothetical protein|nr:hypothetical protein [Candidatus Dojkabacteria bacterium]